MKCLHCGMDNPDNTNFCSNCGAPLNTYSQPQQPQSQQQNQQYYAQQYQQSPYQPPQQPFITEGKKKMGCFTIGLIVLGIFLFAVVGMTLESSDYSERTTSQNSETTTIKESKTTKEETKKEEKDVYTLNRVELKFKSSKVVKEEYGDDYYLIVNFEYTNNSTVTQAFEDCVTLKAFQSGVELQTPISTYGIPDYDFHYSEKEVKPGVTLTVQEAFRLDDRKNAVSVEIYDGIYFIDKPDYEFEIKIKE